MLQDNRIYCSEKNHAQNKSCEQWMLQNNDMQNDIHFPSLAKSHCLLRFHQEDILLEDISCRKFTCLPTIHFSYNTYFKINITSWTLARMSCTHADGKWPSDPALRWDTAAGNLVTAVSQKQRETEMTSESFFPNLIHNVAKKKKGNITHKFVYLNVHTKKAWTCKTSAVQFSTLEHKIGPNFRMCNRNKFLRRYTPKVDSLSSIHFRAQSAFFLTQGIVSIALNKKSLQKKENTKIIKQRMDLHTSVLIVSTRKWNPLCYKLWTNPSKSSCPEGMLMSDNKRQNREADVQKVVYPRSQRSCRDGKRTQTSNPSGTRLCWLSDPDRQQPDPAQGDNPHLSQFHKRNQTSLTSTRCVPMLSTSKKTLQPSC